MITDLLEKPLNIGDKVLGIDRTYDHSGGYRTKEYIIIGFTKSGKRARLQTEKELNSKVEWHSLRSVKALIKL